MNSDIPDLILPERIGGYGKGHDTRELILRTALAILLDEGWPAMSMRRVAMACGLKFGNLTYHFRTRDDLVRALLEAVISAYEREFAETVFEPGLTGEQRLERYCRVVLDDIPTRKTTHLFPELWARANHDAFVHDRMQDLYARARAPLDPIIAEMRPDLAVQDREMLALFISSAMEGSTMFAGYRKPYADRMETIRAMAISAFVALAKGWQP